MAELTLGGIVVDVIAPDAPTFVVEPPTGNAVEVLPVGGPPGKDGDVAPADVDPVLLFENALAGHDD